METESTLIRTNSVIKLYSISLINLNLSFIIFPFNFEGDYSIRLCNSFKNFILKIYRIFINNIDNALNYFSYCLDKFALSWIFSLKLCHKAVYFVHSFSPFDNYRVHSLFLFCQQKFSIL